ncbi:MAG TPA: 2-amino-4-hydroxy-6-hydroxymethyldihydropteridine diphosphokinase [Chthonomonadaceae bacterium]|nr:2-amino-4-hydroxy-6-hydroxymethyldihydropteridine diphosphokinase [Chthonomonadaceae bacterium]
MGSRGDRADGGAVPVLLGLGASLGDRAANLREALRRLADAGVEVRAVSSTYESPHLGLLPGDSERYPAHLNLVAAAETNLSPEALLDRIHEVEAAGGRARSERWGPRTIDIDILDYDGREMRTDRLTLPHPGIAQRAFVAAPLLDLQPDYRLPDGRRLRDRMAEEPLKSQKIVACG